MRYLVGLVALLVLVPSFAWGESGFIIVPTTQRPTCESIPSPVANSTWCADANHLLWRMWNGTAWVAIGGGGITSIGGQTGPVIGLISDINVTLTGSGNNIIAGWTNCLATSRGGTGTCANGVSGGIPYYLTPTTLASSPVLDSLVLGMGAGFSPTNYAGDACPVGEVAISISNKGVLTCSPAGGGSGTVTGTGTTDTLPIWSNGPGGVLGDSILSQPDTSTVLGTPTGSAFTITSINAKTIQLTTPNQAAATGFIGAQTGNSTAAGNSGGIFLQTGQTTSGRAGDIDINTGNALGGRSGIISILGGTSDTSTGGQVFVDGGNGFTGGQIGIAAGDSSGSGQNGGVVLIQSGAGLGGGGAVSGEITLSVGGQDALILTDNLAQIWSDTELRPIGGSGVRELRFYELPVNGLNYVGFKAADALAGNVIWKLPAADGNNGDFLTTNGAGVLSWSAGSGASGITSLNGLSAAVQTVSAGSTNIDWSSSVSTHTFTWTGQLSAARGGTGQDSSGWSAIPLVTAGAWSQYAGSTCPGGQAATSISASGALTCAPLNGGGTVTGSSASPRIAYWSGTSQIQGDPSWLFASSLGLSVTPTGNPPATHSGVSLQQTTISTADRQFLLNVGLSATQGTNDTVGAYVGVDKTGGAANVWALNTVLNQEAASGSYSAFGYELDFNNLNAHRGDADGVAGLIAPVSYGLGVTGAGNFRSTAAILVAGPGTGIWNRGIVFANGSITSSGSTFQDFTSPSKSIDIRGGPVWGIYQTSPASNNWFNGGAILGPVAAVSLPAAGRQGRLMVVSDDNSLRLDTGAVWAPISLPVTPPSNGQLLIGNGVTGRWVAGSLSCSSGASCTFGPGTISITAPGATPAVPFASVQYNNSGAFGGDANFVWDTVNKRLGLGTSSPSQQLHVKGLQQWDVTTTVSPPGMASGTVIMNAKCGTESVGGTPLQQGFFVNHMSTTQTLDCNNTTFINMYKEGPNTTPNDTQTGGIAVAHLGPGSGDNFYANVSAASTQYRDALYRGDLSGGAPFDAGLGLGPPTVFAGYLFSTAEPTSPGLRLIDLRAAPAQRQLLVTAQGTNPAGLLLQNTNGSGRSFAMVSTNTGELFIQEDTGPSLRYTQTSSDTHLFTSPATRQVHILPSGAATTAGIKFDGFGGSSRSYALVSDSSGNLVIQEDVGPSIVFTLTSANRFKMTPMPTGSGGQPLCIDGAGLLYKGTAGAC